MRFELQGLTVHQAAWVFDWTPETGELSGPAAEEIRAIAGDGEVSLHPLPQRHKLSAEPLKSWPDMAAICGRRHRLTPELAEHYPGSDAEYPEGVVF